MKQDRMLTVKLGFGDLAIFHKSMFGRLDDVFRIGNLYRQQSGLPSLSMDAWLRRQEVRSYIDYLSEKLGTPAVYVRRGRSGGRFAHLKILIDAAADLAPEFKDEVYECFIANGMLYWRNRSGDAFIELADMIHNRAPEIFGKDAHKGHYITLSNIIRNRLGVRSWDTATVFQLRERARIEEALTTMLKAGVVRDWDHLKELAEIV